MDATCTRQYPAYIKEALHTGYDIISTLSFQRDNASTCISTSRGHMSQILHTNNAAIPLNEATFILLFTHSRYIPRTTYSTLYTHNAANPYYIIRTHTIACPKPTHNAI